jgi:hypothetical protein
MIFFLPFLILHRLHMSRKMRLGVYCTFLLGLVNIAFSLTRFLTIHLASSIDDIPALSLVGRSCLPRLEAKVTM